MAREIEVLDRGLEFALSDPFVAEEENCDEDEREQDAKQANGDVANIYVVDAAPNEDQA
ncbi:hypothetical protein [Ktedonobacter robiniae]|uniref:Uncharacterized protein n=1 Tax=Ktedonobacter robiniae TaxID=2778365 RepID=A0ABQ3UYV4_9CHLR|nr:hypothetical protein [Ktedonobacter robiniae]GHO58034.1 hypothetical protein KSB_65090 [Ktedonobacter robiniae]